LYLKKDVGKINKKAAASLLIKLHFKYGKTDG